ncbi:MAG: HD domain-containing phosphohydrolase [Rhodocyclaceae bacterium]|nr:HD domain-containing phosphohydrolase [Rhodocyclaceae bacterium]
MKETISTRQIEQGMFVTELDRPWLETPFLLQGFLVDDAAQIAELQKYCATVTIDRSRSIGPHYAAVRYKVDGRHPDRASRPAAAVKTAPDSFYTVCRTLREKPPRRGANKTVPQIFGHDNQSQLEAELLYSAPLVDDVKNKLQSIRQSVDANISDKIKAVVGLVAEMAESIERNPDAMIWLTRLRSSDEYSYDHAVDVSVHLMVLSRFLGMPATTVELLGQVGLMQDIGKINLPESLLRKQETLTDEELALMHSHVASSIEILLDQPNFSHEALSIIGSHHERFDGSGYPRRIQGEKLGLHAELAGLIDCYCAMLRQRAYCSAVSSQHALEQLMAMRDTKFRAPLVDQLIQCIGLYPIGTLVELNSGEVGVVIQQNQVRRLKPRVMIVLGPDKSIERRPRTLDLIMEPATGTGAPYHIVRSLPMDAYGINPADFYLG